MIFTETNLSGAYVIDVEKMEDERGFFARIWDKKEFSRKNLETQFVQVSISHNKKEGTIRGLHFQNKPFEEIKIVNCVKGKIFDVIVDLRPNSKTFQKSFSVELSEKNHKILYIPKGMAHGFQTLEDNSDVLYQISEFYEPNSSKGIRWNDPSLNINWPLEVTTISKRDQTNPIFSEIEF